MKLLKLLALGLIFSSGTALAAKPLSPNTSFETTDGTITPLVGEVVSGSGDGPGWAGSWVSTYLPTDIVYDNSRSATGQWSMLLDTSGRNEEPSIGRVFSKPIKKGLALLRVQVNRNDRNSIGIFLSNGDPNLGGATYSGRAIYVGIDPAMYHNTTPGGGDVAAYDGTTGVVLADDAAPANVWHEFLIEFNCNADGGTYNVYLNGDKLNTTPLHFYAPQVSIDRIDVYTGANQDQGGSSDPTPGSKHWVEDVVIWRK